MFQSTKLLSHYTRDILARDICRGNVAHEHFKFSGYFLQNYESISLPYNLKFPNGTSSNSSLY